MSDARIIAAAAAPMAEVIREIKPDQLTAPTPCVEYDVRKLLTHLLFWGPSLEAAARKESVPPPAESEAEVALPDGGLVTAVEAHLARTVQAWSEPRAWQGSTFMGGKTELPATLVGGMVVGELVVHGWDLARATDQYPVFDDTLLEYLHEEIAKTAPQGREMGVYGPEVTVPPGSSTFDQLLALTGRDPAWRRECR